MLRSFSALAAIAAVLLVLPAHAHHAASHRVTAPDAPAGDVAVETVGGTLESLPVLDLRTGASVRYFSLRQADGTRVGVKWLGAEVATPGAQVRLEGKRNGDTFFVERSATLVAADASFVEALPRGAQRYTGKLEFLHADDFDRGSCDLVYTLKDEDGGHVQVRFPVAPEILERGMSLAVDAVPTDDGVTVEARAIEIHADAVQEKSADVQAKIAGTTQVLVMLIKYADTPTEPYTQAVIQGRVFTDATSVANYYRESSYTKHQLAGVVTPWLRARFNKPASCLYSQVATEAQYLAQQAGYNLASYQKYVYIFPSLPGCGWAGLGGGSQAWINQAASLLVIGHELGHTFGMGHASSLDCGTQVIGTTCTRSEYGDPYEIMGNQRGAHLNAIHKSTLGYFGAGEVKTHPGGTATYTLSALELPGGSTYAVKVAASATRNYWLEWRQPIGFDASLGTGATNGALVHLGYPSDFGCSTCLLDMTPATTTFTDGALPVGQTFTDSTTSTSIAVLTKTATALTVQVTSPLRGTFVDVPSTHAAYAAVEALVWNGVTLGCAINPARFCPDAPVTRAEMAVFIERVKRGSTFTFTPTGTRFADVPATHWAAGFIEQLHIDGITSGCATGPLRYCPGAPITRAAMAPMLLKARWGSTFNPGTATGTVFADIPRTHAFAAWIEKAYQYGISLGCTVSPRNYCPDATVTRAQMAMFLQRAFNLASPPS
jgi:Gametolysin peptidase M11/S-layer homology domain